MENASRKGTATAPWRALLDSGPVAGMGDGPLLERFANRDGIAAEAAFAVLVTRHGPMVRRLCRATLADSNDVDDAFQATFLVLARKARAIREPDRLASWLHGTALRASRKLRDQSARRARLRSRLGAIPPERPGGDPAPEEVRREEARAVHEELARLPGSCRDAAILCDLDGLTHDEAARRLGCSERTLRRRLSHARDLLRDRLTRRGLAPTAAALATALAPESAPAAPSERTIDAIARAASRFAAGKSAAGTSSAPAFALAEGVLVAMTWTKLQGIAIASGMLLALGAGLGSGLAASSSQQPSAPKPRAEGKAKPGQPSPAEQYRALVKRYDDAVEAYRAAVAKAEAPTPEEVSEIYKRLGPFPADHTPAFVALAERFPGDPAAVDALLWVVEKSLSSLDGGDDPFGRAVGRAMDILARDHAGDPRLGPLCLKLTMYLSPRREAFLREIAARSPDRVVKGRASLALAKYLTMKGECAAMLRGSPPDFAKLSQDAGSDDLKKQYAADPAKFLREAREFYSKYQPDLLKQLLAADPEAIRREAAATFDRVAAEYADVPDARFDGRPTRETLADVARRTQKPAPAARPGAVADARPSEGFEAIAAAFRAAQQKANEASEAAGREEAGVRAYIAAAPRWADFGPKMWRIAEDAPRSPEALDALLWIVGHDLPFFDAREEREAMLGRAVDALIRDHLDFIGQNLDARNVAEAFNHGSPMPAPHVDRLFRALHDRGRTREVRGRMGLALARHLKAEADLAESFAVRGTDPARRPEVAMWSPAYIEQLRSRGRAPFDAEAVAILERVKADFGDVTYVNGTVPTADSLATVADRDLADLKTLAVGQAAPEIAGEDVDGRPMALSGFRGRVVLLDFGSHEHCGGCKLVYPRLRALVDRHKGRPFIVLGINSQDRRETLKQEVAKGEITWRSWWAGDKPGAPGPITERWNVRAYPTFILIDHRGVIRTKDLHPFDVRNFDETLERLLDDAEPKK